jgi:hypothetical protein
MLLEGADAACLSRSLFASLLLKEKVRKVREKRGGSDDAPLESSSTLLLTRPHRHLPSRSDPPLEERSVSVGLNR